MSVKPKKLEATKVGHGKVKFADPDNDDAWVATNCFINPKEVR